MSPHDPEALSRLRGFLEVTRVVRSEEELGGLLASIAKSISESLGFATVAVHLHRPAWDDFEVTTVHGSPEAVEGLMGDARRREVWEPLLDERFARRGAYHVPHGAFDWETHAPGSYVPSLETGAGPDDWHPLDALFVPLRHPDGHLVGILSVDEPASGRIPTDEELDVLVAMADHAAIAVQSTQEAEQAARHRSALEQLLQVSSRLTETFSIDEILRSVCDGIHTALGFENVCIDLPDPDTGVFRTRAAHGWDIDDEAVNTAMTFAQIERLLDAEFEVEGCYLLDHEQGLERVAPEHHTYQSVLSGRGQLAWRNHWLIVPLWSRTGELMGAIWADDPVDRLVPSERKLQALRVFANQATTALDTAAQYEQMQFLAEHDPLTRLFNRRAFNERLEQEVARSVRYDHPMALVLCDLNGFKALNDRNGHAAGDEALEVVGGVLQSALRTADAAFRIGGDEFALILPETDEDEARAAVERVAEAMSAAFAGRNEQLAAGFGVAVCPRDGDDPRPLFRAADRAMYAAKPRVPRSG
ncbi:MAG TPA: diguanylate cyclase [Gaiellales bacterium]|jgi:diguanylate cyclase (GGDEF)-like protein|nr:diguanylate cyclase [Gaiellales bacterium]